jgi:ABC-2 type transport system ATP-binding protein
MAVDGKQRIKLVLSEGVEIRHLYQLAAEHQVQIRKLDYKRDSLQDIFLKAMETPEVRQNGRL